MKNLVPMGRIEQRILLVRGERVILDADLAEKTKVVANCDHLKRIKFSPVLPFTFTEHGAIMVASILNTRRAMEVSVYVVRAFVQLRGIMKSNKELAGKLVELEQRISGHDRYIQNLFDAIRALMKPEGMRTRKIGFRDRKS